MKEVGTLQKIYPHAHFYHFLLFLYKWGKEEKKKLQMHEKNVVQKREKKFVSLSGDFTNWLMRFAAFSWWDKSGLADLS